MSLEQEESGDARPGGNPARAIKYDAKYGFWGMPQEAYKSVPRLEGEGILAAGEVRLEAGANPVFALVTNLRACVLRRRLFKADSILEIPYAAITSVRLPGDCVELEYVDENGGGAAFALPLMREDFGEALAAAVQKANHMAAIWT